MGTMDKDIQKEEAIKTQKALTSKIKDGIQKEEAIATQQALADKIKNAMGNDIKKGLATNGRGNVQSSVDTKGHDAAAAAGWRLDTEEDGGGVWTLELPVPSIESL